MTLQGDLSTLDLGDLLQNLEANERTGMLSVQGSEATFHMYFAKGRMALLSYERRPQLMDVLVASGVLTAAELEKAKKRRRGTKRSLGEVLVARKLVPAETLLEVATARLLDEACELIASDTGAFTFTEGKVPRGVFDPEERRLNMRIAAGPLLMEAARREDHWRLIRQRVPSDSAHYMSQRKAREAAQNAGENAALASALLELFDGTRSVTEVMASFPHRRFEAYHTLAEFVETRVLRLAEPDDMVRLARDLARVDLDRGWQVVHRGLAVHPQHLGLLVEQAVLAEELGQMETAAEALKMIVHLRLEGGDAEGAATALEDAKRVGPSDTAIWERSLALALDEERTEDAVADGEHLAKLYRVPGLHRKAWKVYEKLVDLEPLSWKFRKELAHSQADCGELALAIDGLKRFAKHFLSRGEYGEARVVYEEILTLDPNHEEAQEVLQRIETGVLERRRAQRRKLLHRGMAVLGTLTLAATGYFEVMARQAFVQAEREVSEAELIELGRYDAAILVFERVADEYPRTTTSLYDVRRRVRELKRKGARGLAPALDPAQDGEAVEE